MTPLGKQWRRVGRSGALFLLSADLPSASLSLGPTLVAEKIKEGDDVYFECSIDAKPPIYKTSWWFNVSKIRAESHIRRMSSKVGTGNKILTDCSQTINYDH